MERGFLTGIIARIPLALFGAALVLASCTREDLSDCPPAYNLRLLVKTDYEHPMQSRGSADYNWYAGQINSVTVYAFDENDYFVASWTGGAYSLGEDYVVNMNMEKSGNYHFVAWTNCGDTYSASRSCDELDGSSRLNELTVNLNVPADETLRDDIPHRHYGVLENAAVVDGRENTHTIVVSPHTYKVNFTVRGLTGKPYEVEITDNNIQHTFDARYFAGGGHYHHRRPLAPATNSDDIAASMILLQIGDATETIFDLIDATTETSVYTADLLATIRTKYNLTDDGLQQMLEDVYEYDIILTFGTGGGDSALGVEVDVRAWGYRDNSTNL